MNMRDLHPIFFAGIAAVASFTGTVAAQTVVVGTGNPDIDIAAVQTAVDRGGAVTLRGRFSFDNPPTRHGTLPDLMATILVSKEVTISGAWDEHGEMTTIAGGEIPFAVEARGAVVRIEKLRFLRPKLYGIFADAVSGLTIESCTIERLEPLPFPGQSNGLRFVSGIYIATLLGLANRERPGNPENISGKLSILNNQISVSEAADEGMGIMIVSVGGRENPVEVDITGNTIRNTTQKGINVWRIGGRARIERNIVTTAVYTGHASNYVTGIHCACSGSYLIAHNRIDVADPNGVGIRIKGCSVGGAAERASITDNDVFMSATEGAVLGAGSAGIEIKGLARGTVVQRNRIRGRARIGLSVAPDKAGNPTGNTFDRNDQENLTSPLTEGGKQP
jgi:Right handed beta helix region